MTSIKLPYPHLGQQIVRNQARRFNWLMAGRRWRKTTLAMAIAVEGALEGQQILWGAPVFDQVRVGWQELKRAAGSVADFNQSAMTVQFPSKGRIIFRSLDNPDSARGWTADGIVIDEAGDVAAAAYYEVLMPMLITTSGWMWAIGTPKGMRWFTQEYLNSASRQDSISWQAPTLGVEIEGCRLIRKPHPLENPEIEFSEIQGLYERTPEDVFKQEILAIPLRGEGAVFRNIEACLHAQPSTPDQHKGHRIGLGGDWAQKRDWTALSVGCLDCKVELELMRFNKIDWALQRGRLAALSDKWDVKEILLELNSIGSPNFEALILEGLGDKRVLNGFETTASSKPPLIQSLALALERTEFQWLPDPVGKGELLAYESKIGISGRPQYSAPEGGNDDTVIARALLNWIRTSVMDWKTA